MKEGEVVVKDEVELLEQVGKDPVALKKVEMD